MKSPRSFGIGLAACLALLAAGSVAAQERPGGGQPQSQQFPQPGQQAPQPAPQNGPVYVPGPGFPPPEPLPTVALAQLLERVARSSNKQFLVDARTPQQIYLGGVRPEDVNYPLLLSILRNNGIAAATVEGRVNIMPDAFIRAFPVPSVSSDDAKIPDDEVVQRVITTSSIETPGLVPVLRPLLPQSAHLAASSPNKLIVVDRYANVKRISELVKALDR